MKISRRNLMQSAAAGGFAFAIPSYLNAASHAKGVSIDLTAGEMAFRFDGDAGGVSKLWTYNKSLPGPEIRVKKGEVIRAAFLNELEEATSIHWHGIRIENAMDGVAGLTQDAVEPGDRFDYEFSAPDAGTYWYHAHNRSWNQVARGLYGPLIVEEDNPLFDRQHDLTLMIDDWRVDENAVLDTGSLGSLMDWSHGGRLGNWLTVNGTSLPEYPLVAGEHYRLRLINASNARIYHIDARSLGASVIALDGQALNTPLDAPDPLLLAPAQRADLLVTPMPGKNLELQEVSGNQPFTFVRFKMTGDRAGEAVTAPRLQPNALPKPDLNAARRISVRMTGGAMGDMSNIRYNGEILDREGFMQTGQLWALNGIANLTDAPLFSVKRGESVVIEVVNDTGWPHGMHTHGHHFQVVGSDGNIPENAPWRDTVLLQRREQLDIAFVADNPGKWLFHCHMLEHAAAGMNTWFEVTA